MDLIVKAPPQYRTYAVILKRCLIIYADMKVSDRQCLRLGYLGRDKCVDYLCARHL